MKKIIAIILCGLVLALSGCSPKYQRISFNDDSLCELPMQYINTNTHVINTSTETFSDCFPVYQILKRNISDREYQQMLQQLGISGHKVKLDGNKITAVLTSYGTDTGEFHMSEEEVKNLAWETFNKLPFMEGEYEYCGINKNEIISDSNGTRVTRVGVSFRRILDGIKIMGNDRCYFVFDNTGLAEFYINRYDYIKIGTLEMVPLESAFDRIKNPDALSFETENVEQSPGVFDTLRVEKAGLVFYNQAALGCTILQPVYNFDGIATDANEVQVKFNARIIAIPESYTYEKPLEPKN